MALVGYARVSSKEQNLARQITALEEAGVSKLFKESVSGKNVEDRVEFNKMMTFLREGDTLVIHSLDRLSRNYNDILKTVQDLKARDIKLKVLDSEYLNIDTGNKELDQLMFNMMINLLGFVAENERTKIRERQQEGIKLAKERGAYANNGAVKKYSPTGTEKERYFAIVDDLEAGRPIAHIAKDRGVSRPTIYDIKKELESTKTLEVSK